MTMVLIVMRVVQLQVVMFLTSKVMMTMMIFPRLVNTYIVSDQSWKMKQIVHKKGKLFLLLLFFEWVFTI